MTVVQMPVAVVVTVGVVAVVAMTDVCCNYDYNVTSDGTAMASVVVTVVVVTVVAVARDYDVTSDDPAIITACGQSCHVRESCV